MLPESLRTLYPIIWAGQDRLFPRLPAHLQRMALFAVNTGLRDSNVCSLQWTGEVSLPELRRNVFVVPVESFKSKRDHSVILNDVAWSIVQSQRGLRPGWVFPFLRHRIDSMNNTGWQNARCAVRLRQMRVHDLRHTFACRLRAAGGPHGRGLFGAARPGRVLDVGALGERPGLAIDRVGQSGAEPTGDAHRLARCQRLAVGASGICSATPRCR